MSPPKPPAEGATGDVERASTSAATTSVRVSRSLAMLSVLLAAAGSLLATELSQRAQASRNSSGVYSLPSGNPVQTGTTISSSWANSTLSDIGTEVTNSLDRNGRGAMASALQLSAGTVAAPSLTFSAETGSGIFRAASNDVEMSVNQSSVEKWLAGGVTMPGTLQVNGRTGLNGRTATTYALEMADGPANGTLVQLGTTLPLTLWASSGLPTVGFNVANSGSGNKYIASNTAGAIQFDTGANINFYTATSGTAGAAATLTNRGSIGPSQWTIAENAQLSGTNPGSSTGFANTLTPKNLIKAWGIVSCSGSCSVLDGFNIAAATTASSNVIISMATGMSSTSYAVVATDMNGGAGAALALAVIPGSRTTSAFTVTAVNPVTGAQAGPVLFSVAVMGAQ